MMGITCRYCAYVFDEALVLRENLRDYVRAEREREEAEIQAEATRRRDELHAAMGV